MCFDSRLADEIVLCAVVRNQRSSKENPKQSVFDSMLADETAQCGVVHNQRSSKEEKDTAF